MCPFWHFGAAVGMKEDRVKFSTSLGQVLKEFCVKCNDAKCIMY